MKPFDDYPQGGDTILCNKLSSANTRRKDGHWLVKRGQSSCAYCEMSLIDSYEHWLLLTVDHVIPRKEGHRLRIPRDWRESYSNIVLACSGCNGFRNRYEISWQEHKEFLSESEFLELRDRVFQERKALIEKARNREKHFYTDHVAPLCSSLTPSR